MNGCSENAKSNLSDHDSIEHEELADVFLDRDFERNYSQMDKVFRQQVSLKEIKDIGEEVDEMNAEQPFGNYIIIDHGNDKYSYLTHFKYQSIIVHEGDDIKQGDVLGLVGHSGNSSEPHIHFHVANSPDPYDSYSIRINLVGHEK